ncbi:hypothetical protein SLEP1_g35150 [Rubroshorea leprosula]|uniref:Uncharacterized protein n=1 Tax=Rubroshorea leprosula TaxID=152421 RepID=A0AAV5KML6_9ROSI|nr:hypothetical protein SLEP1_g35150 [Rubroshorea leprosula]
MATLSGLSVSFGAPPVVLFVTFFIVFLFSLFVSSDLVANKPTMQALGVAADLLALASWRPSSSSRID